MTSSSVQISREPVSYPTFVPFPPQKNPLFLENRVYQGSSGRVYPLPVIDRIAEQPVERSWDAVRIENEFLEVLILPEIGGRIHAIRDKTNGYDLIYRQNAIKPALVGLAGPWLSGGIELNWPQHHRPSTYMPVNVEIEEHDDGSKTVWLSEHDPMDRLKGMHGVCLHPGRSVVELKARAYNRTPLPKTFLWWANVATQVHEAYQSFFPPDVHYVADHAKRATAAYPLCAGRYYGVDYGGRGRNGVPPNEAPRQFVPRGDYAPNDLSWYANIPVPTSYMAMGSRENFFGGYDHARGAGIVHVANHHIAPGKKQWTWGNHDFGYAWDRNLTTPDRRGVYAPYIEIMAGVYTDNQPDFSFLQPGETKTWSQFWYPIRDIGPAQQANTEAALSLGVNGRLAHVGIAATRAHEGAELVVEARGRTVHRATLALGPDRPHVATVKLPAGTKPHQVRATVYVRAGSPDPAVTELSDHSAATRATAGSGAPPLQPDQILIAYQPAVPAKTTVPPPATEPAAPRDIASADQLYLTGVHLDQYRHATRKPELYWREALRRDPGDARCNHAMGAWHLRRGEFDVAERHLRTAIARLTERNPNPADGEPYYTLGLCLRLQADALEPHAATAKWDDAYAAFYKATWNHAWQAAAYHALAEIDCARGDWAQALDHLDRALRMNADNLRARDLRAMVLQQLGRDREARDLLQATLALDPLDWWARYLLMTAAPTAASDGSSSDRSEQPQFSCDTQTRLDLAHDLARAGFFAAALDLLQDAKPEPHSGTAPLVAYTAAWIASRQASLAAAPASKRPPRRNVRPDLRASRSARQWLRRAAAASPDYCFPARLEEQTILQWASAANPRDARAPYYLGNLLYDRRRHDEAIACWERSARLDRRYSVVWRNLGLAYFNIRHDPARARRAYDTAFHAAPTDARLLFERDQLWKRVGVAPAQRLRELERRVSLVRQRDDLSLELCALYNLTAQPAKALALLMTRRFQPWEGGEGQALGQHVRSHLALGRAALQRGDIAEARRHFEVALACPENLGEARHPLANASDIHFWIGEAAAAAHGSETARQHWTAAATFSGDFQDMAVRAYSELTYYSALAWRRLGDAGRAQSLLRQLLAYARQLGKTEAKIDYFATSLPTMLLFNDDLTARQRTTAMFLEAQAHRGLGQASRARKLLADVLRRDPSYLLAAEFRQELSPTAGAIRANDRHAARDIEPSGARAISRRQ